MLPQLPAALAASPTDSDVRAALLSFYDAHARDLPWRRTRDPYAIWVSEIMLQQTRVETVLRYYDRFLQRFPTPQALASASEDAVLAAWSGLGYYRRARLLHAGVREVVASYGGQLPRDASERRKLPGIGRYTAGAIGSIAFDLQEPLVDGNVARVFARLFGIDTPLGRADTEALLWQHAERLARGPRPGALNQALMELGATLCSKSAPQCTRCPVRGACVAHAQARQDELPVVRKKTPPKPVSLVAIIATCPAREQLALVRGQDALFGGLWNLPMHAGTGLASARSLANGHALELSLTRKPLGRIAHVLTHRKLTIEVYAATLRTLPREAHVRTFPMTKLDELGLSTLTRKALRLARPTSG